MRSEVFDSFCVLLMGVLIGEAKHGTVRASVFAPATYQPQRLNDLFCRHKLSHQAFMAARARLVLRALYQEALPARLSWLADSTPTEKLCSELYAFLRFHALRLIRMLDRADVADEIGELDQLRRRVAASDHDVQHLAPITEYLEYLRYI